MNNRVTRLICNPSLAAIRRQCESSTSGWLKADEEMKPQRIEYDAHVAELMLYGEEVFWLPIGSTNLAGAAAGLERCALACRSLAEITSAAGRSDTARSVVSRSIAKV